MTQLWILFALLVLSFSCTALLRAYALRRNVLDIPNERSSHQIPTPRGGGVAVVLSYLAAIALLAMDGGFATAPAAALFAGGSIIAVIGFLDDHGHVNAKWRLLVHFTGAMLVVAAAGGLPALVMFGFTVDFGVMGYVLATIAVVWILNLFNFMDGIDGIAGLEAVSVSVVMALLGYSQFGEHPLVPLMLFLEVCSLGFLLWNLPPARIFMGDAGSGFIGFQLAALALLSAHLSEKLLWCWLIMLGVFIVDATFTLLNRLRQGFKVYEAHRSHAYQHAAIQYRSHARVSYSVLLINLCWLAPWAGAVVLAGVDGATALVIAYLPLIYLVIRFKAGRVCQTS